jgi:hypothetical protein
MRTTEDPVAHFAKYLPADASAQFDLATATRFGRFATYFDRIPLLQVACMNRFRKVREHPLMVAGSVAGALHPIAAAAGPIDRKCLIEKQYLSAAKSMSVALVVRPKLKRMALCARRSSRPSARST